MKVLVLDTSAFIIGFNPLSAGLISYSVPAVERELQPGGFASVRYKTSRELGRLIIRMPSNSSHRAVLDKSMELGEKYELSEADVQVLALALDLEREGKVPVVVSDDYSIQNVAEHLALEYSSLATFGISYGFNWIRYCPACFRKYVQNYSRSTCEVCGTELKRKVLKRLPIRKKS